MSPATNSQKSKVVPPLLRPPQGSTPPPTPSTPKPSSAPGTATSINERLERLSRNENPSNHQPTYSNQQFCHYFTNFGKCFYEEKTGRKCRFEHTVAPMCQSGIACSRPKCMYTHPNMDGRNEAFLGRSSGMQNAAPWPQMMNQFMNPWKFLSMNPFQQQTMNPFQQQGMGRGMQN